MARLFPLRSETPTTEGTPRVVDLDDEDADAVFGALSSTTAREIYATLDTEPGTPSDVAEAIDSSIQNVRYHLEKLEDAGLVEVIDTWYSSRGNEMSVYATANGPLIVTSDESRAAQLKQAVSRYIGGVGLLAAASFVLQAAAMRFEVPGTDAAADGGTESPSADGTVYINDDSRTETDSTNGSEFQMEQTASGNTSDGTSSDDADVSPLGAEDGGGAEPDGIFDAGSEFVISTADGLLSLDSPGLLFFLGGVAVLTALVAWWYVTSYRPTAST